jgi:hypothetical protein
MIRKWLKELLREVLKEETKKVPMIIAYRIPGSCDIYEKGTLWKTAQDTYLCTEVKAIWEKK